MTPAFGLRTQPQIPEGVTVTGEAVRRIQPESAEFLIEVAASASTAGQALRDNHAKATQVIQALAPLGVQQADIQTISLKVLSLYSPTAQSLPYGGMPQIGGGISPYTAAAALQPEVQFGSYHASNTLRVTVREPGRLGDIADAATRTGATVGAFQFRATNEGNARRDVLEAAARDARTKAEGLATAVGKQLGEPVSIAEEIVTCNGAFGALRAMMPLAFGAGAPQVTGELEYYARLSASFRFQ
jgi:uncharacterized protein YggE